MPEFVQGLFEGYSLYKNNHKYHKEKAAKKKAEEKRGKSCVLRKDIHYGMIKDILDNDNRIEVSVGEIK